MGLRGKGTNLIDLPCRLRLGGTRRGEETARDHGQESAAS
jgi:hypothetical protein